MIFGRTELIIGESGAENRQDSVGRVRFLVAPQNFAKNPKNFASPGRMLVSPGPPYHLFRFCFLFVVSVVRQLALTILFIVLFLFCFFFSGFPSNHCSH